MKTTIELPDDLVAKAKATAIRRRTTLKALVEHGLRREISQLGEGQDNRATFTVDEHGLPLLKQASDSSIVTSEAIYGMMDELGI